MNVWMKGPLSRFKEAWSQRNKRERSLKEWKGEGGDLGSLRKIYIWGSLMFWGRSFRRAEKIQELNSPEIFNFVGRLKLILSWIKFQEISGWNKDCPWNTMWNFIPYMKDHPNFTYETSSMIVIGEHGIWYNSGHCILSLNVNNRVHHV